jgi:hypothetical protein
MEVSCVLCSHVVWMPMNRTLFTHDGNETGLEIKRSSGKAAPLRGTLDESAVYGMRERPSAANFKTASQHPRVAGPSGRNLFCTRVACCHQDRPHLLGFQVVIYGGAQDERAHRTKLSVFEAVPMDHGLW